MDYTLEELPEHEGTKMFAELTAVLEKYDAEIGVKSVIQILKRVPVSQEKESILSFLTQEDIENGNNSDRTTEESS